MGRLRDSEFVSILDGLLFSAYALTQINFGVFFGSRQDSHVNHSASANQGVSWIVDGIEVVGELHHGTQAVLESSDVLKVLGVLRLDEVSHEALHSLAVLHPLVNKGLGHVLLGLRGRRH